MAYPTSVNDQITDSVSISSVKSIAEQPAMLSNLAYANLIANTNLSQQNAVANQQAMNQLGISIVGKTVNMISNLGPLEARSAVDLLTDNDVASDIADLKAANASEGGSAGNGTPSGSTSK